MDVLFALVIFGTIALGIGAGVLIVKAKKWLEAKMHEEAIERDVRQGIADAAARKKVADKILRQSGQTP